MSDSPKPELERAHESEGKWENFQTLKLAILKVSDTRSEKSDDVGKGLVEMVEKEGHEVLEKIIVKDDKYQIRAAISNWIANRSAQVIITTGGTGITGRDGTPEAIRPLFDKELDGFGEIFRAKSFEKLDWQACNQDVQLA